MAMKAVMAKNLRSLFMVEAWIFSICETDARPRFSVTRVTHSHKSLVVHLDKSGSMIHYTRTASELHCDRFIDPRKALLSYCTMDDGMGEGCH